MAGHLLVQISDIHLTPEGPLFPFSRPRDNLIAGLEALDVAGLRPDVFVLTGDLANSGDPECYRDLASIMAAATEPIGATVVYLPGNHDLRPGFRRHLLGLPEGPDPINQVHWHDGLRIVSLDTSVPGEEAGELADETLEFLVATLSEPAADGTVLALHHPPVASPIEPMARIMLRRPERLAAVIDGSDVRLVLSGHNHHGMAGTLASVPVWVSPATAYEMDVLSRDAIHGLPGTSVSQIDLQGGETTVSAIRVPVGHL